MFQMRHILKYFSSSFTYSNKGDVCVKMDILETFHLF